MLTELHIESLGVIERLDLTLGPGMTAVTGETGAGKTMLVEALELLVGGRAEATIVRPGAIEARIDGRFVAGDIELVLTRVVPAEGRSRAYIDGRPATVGALAEAAAGLVDLHGQHDHQSLLAGPTQRQALDRFGSIELGPLRAARTRLTELDAELVALGGDRARAGPGGRPAALPGRRAGGRGDRGRRRGGPPGAGRGRPGRRRRPPRGRRCRSRCPARRRRGPRRRRRGAHRGDRSGALPRRRRPPGLDAGRARRHRLRGSRRRRRDRGRPGTTGGGARAASAAT